MENQSQKSVVIKDEDFGYSLNLFSLPEHCIDCLESVLIPHGLILDRIEKVAEEIIKNSKDELVLLCVLKGAHQVFSDLCHFIKRINLIKKPSISLKYEFIRLKSYLNETSTENLSISDFNFETITNKNILIIEDIVDTGRTLTALIDKLIKYNPTSVKTFSLIYKRTHLNNGFVPDYIGFNVPDKFIVGYCLDYNEQFRDINHICILNSYGKTKYSINSE